MLRLDERDGGEGCGPAPPGRQAPEIRHPSQGSPAKHHRNGAGEQIHDVLKNELAGGTMPSKHFGVKAARCLITVQAHNLKPGDEASWSERRLKDFRFHLIRLPGRVTQHAGEVIARVSRPTVRFLRGDPKTGREAQPCGPGLTIGEPGSACPLAASMDASQPSACPKAHLVPFQATARTSPGAATA